MVRRRAAREAGVHQLPRKGWTAITDAPAERPDRILQKVHHRVSATSPSEFTRTPLTWAIPLQG
jgi:hypothetical protein